MEDYGMLTIKIAVMLTAQREKHIVVFRQHCSKSEAPKLIREYAQHNQSLANVTVSITWQVQPVQFNLAGEEA